CRGGGRPTPTGRGAARTRLHRNRSARPRVSVGSFRPAGTSVDCTAIAQLPSPGARGAMPIRFLAVPLLALGLACASSAPRPTPAPTSAADAGVAAGPAIAPEAGTHGIDLSS